MRIVTIIGIILIIVGIVSLIFGGISYTKERKVLDIGPLKAEVHEKKTIPISPVIGGVLLVAGIVLVVSGPKHA